MENNELEIKSNTVRVNIRISQKLKKYFEDKSAETGVSQSALMALALEEYLYQKQAVDFMTGFDSTLAKMEEFNSLRK